MKLLSFLLPKKNEINKIGLVLSGGGVRGIAHLGVLKALNEGDIFPDYISGVSAGALAGVFYSDGYKPDEIFEIFYNSKVFDFTRAAIPRKGFMSLEKTKEILRDSIWAKDFKDLKTPLFVAASNLNDGKIDYFDKGELMDPILASISIPVLFKPTMINNKTYVDGGVFDNLPTSPIKDKCSILIGSHVNPQKEENDLESIISIAERTFHLAIGSSVQENSKDCDIFIEPPELRNYGMFKLDHAKEIYNIGYQATKDLLSKTHLF
jgi:NTE family protein